MDYLRVLLVPFHATSLILVAVFALLLSICGAAGFYGMFAQLFMQIWVIKYCYALLEDVADGGSDPPVMSTDMVSPLEVRPWVQLTILIVAVLTCRLAGGTAAWILAILFLALLPASIGVLGIGEPFYQAVNPLLLWRLIRGLGPLYLGILAAMPLYLAVIWAASHLGVWSILQHAAGLLCQLSFFSLIGGSIYLRRRQLGIEPSRSPERAAAREETERVKLRARMIDDVFQQVRIGKHVEATRPLAKWLSGLDGETAARDAQYIAAQALGWESPAGLNTLASTLIRHLLRAGRPDAALAIFARLRERAPTLTLDSSDDLRSLADYAEASGRTELAVSMRLETPVFRP
jgi:pentatricopeptide repeat protein